MNNCNCPEPSALTEIPSENCGVNMDQIQRIGYQRTQTDAPFDATTVLTLSAWQDFMDATDDTKIVVSPLIGGDPIIEPGAAITSGGNDNSTLNGIPQFDGVEPSAFSTKFNSLSAAQEAAFKKLMCETNMTVYFFLQGGKIATKKVSADVSGFSIQSLFISDRGNAGFGTKDTFNHSFGLLPGWSDNLVIYTPSFNPLTEL